MGVDPHANAEDKLTLYSYWRSSAAYRVRIALNLKNLSYTTIPVHLVKDGGEQHHEEFRLLNPQGLVPVLLSGGQAVTQSIAICEYLDEQYQQHPLLPADPLERAQVRSLALQIACDIHPINNLRVIKFLKAHYGELADPVEWMSHWMNLGFAAIEKQLNGRHQDFVACISGQPGLFECCLLPQTYNAERFGIDMSPFPRIQHIVEKCSALSSFSDAAPENQPDVS